MTVTTLTIALRVAYAFHLPAINFMRTDYYYERALM